jgi:predicted RNA-binding Zn ribbon-like protein
MEHPMATQTTTPTTKNVVDPAAFEEAAERIRALNERLIEGAKAAGLTSLDAYETALKSLVDFETKVAGASQLEWVNALVTTHAKFVQDVSAAYTKAARDLLS